MSHGIHQELLKSRASLVQGQKRNTSFLENLYRDEVLVGCLAGSEGTAFC